jgi:hypothetical protein
MHLILIQFYMTSVKDNASLAMFTFKTSTACLRRLSLSTGRLFLLLPEDILFLICGVLSCCLHFTAAGTLLVLFYRLCFHFSFLSRL